MAELIPNPHSPAPPPTAQNPPPRRTSWIWALAGVIILIIGIVLFRRHHAESAARAKPATPPPLPVAMATARKGNIGVYVTALGTVTPVRTVMLKSRVDGQLMSVNYKEGQLVQAGDLLIQIDPRPFEAQLIEAQGQLARDRALLENAHVDFDRYQIAFSKNAIAKQQLDTQLATVHQYEGTVKFDEGQVTNAELQLTYSRITAPITGRVGLRLVDPGNIVHASDANALAVITQLDPIDVVFSVAEDYLPEIQKQLANGQKLAVDAFDRSQQKKLTSGILLTLDNQIDPTTGTIKLKAEFPNPDGTLFANQFVNARLLVKTEHEVTLVPSYVVQRSAQGSFVYAVQTNQTVAMSNVTVGVTDGQVTAVEGIEPGATLVADNFNRLQDGMKIAPKKSERDHKNDGGQTNRMARAEKEQP